MSEDWLVECILCGQQHRIDRRSLHISVMEQGNEVEHYFWTELTCKGCGKDYLSAQRSIATKTEVLLEKIMNAMMLIIYNHQ